MITGDKERLDQIVQTHECPVHGNKLVVAWSAEENSYVIRCGGGHFPEEVTRTFSLTEAYLQGEELPSPLKENVEKGLEKRKAKEGVLEPARRLGFTPILDLGTNKALTASQVEMLINYAIDAGLSIGLGHVCLMYGKPYPMLDGLFYHAKRTWVSYSLTGRPLTEEELKARGYKPEDLGYLARIKFLSGGAEFEGVGFITKEEREAVVEGKPYQKRYPVVAEKHGMMVQKRAEWQVLRKAFPLGAPEEKEED